MKKELLSVQESAAYGAMLSRAEFVPDFMLDQDVKKTGDGMSLKGETLANTKR